MLCYSALSGLMSPAVRSPRASPWAILLCAFGAPDTAPVLCAFGAPDTAPVLCAFGAPDNAPVLCAFGAPDNAPVLCAFGVRGPMILQIGYRDINRDTMSRSLFRGMPRLRFPTEIPTKCRDSIAGFVPLKPIMPSILPIWQNSTNRVCMLTSCPVGGI